MKSGKPTAESDLEWLLGSGDAAMGYRAQAYEPSSAGVWDEDRIERAHLAHLDDHHRHDVDRHARVTALFKSMSAIAQLVATAAYTPRAWPTFLRSACRRHPFVGVVVISAEARSAFTSAKKRAPRDGAELVEWLAGEATKPNAKATFVPLVAAATNLLEGALAEYTELAAKRDAGELSEMRTGT